jgi:hypothetical protein
MKEALRSSETSVLTRATRRNIPEDTFFLVLLQTFMNNDIQYFPLKQDKLNVSLYKKTEQNLQLLNSVQFCFKPGPSYAVTN